MSEVLDELRANYRDIKAPQHLATRIKAEVSDRPLPSR